MKNFDELVVNYMPLADKLAWKKKATLPKRVQIDELKSAAYMGLVDAAKKYNPTFGTSFATYATLRILGEIQDYLRQLSWGKNNSMVSLSFDEELSIDPIDTKRDVFEEKNEFDYLINCLSDIGRKVMIWYYCDGISQKEIGKKLNITESRTCQLLKEYKQIIKEKFNETDQHISRHVFDVIHSDCDSTGIRNAG